MNESIHEQLSALMDGELDGDQTRFVLARAERDPDVAVRWARYQFAAQVLRREHPVMLRDGFSESVMGAITCVIIAEISGKYCGKRAALEAGLLAAMERAFLFFTAPALKETLMLLVLALFLRYALRALLERKGSLIAGLLLAACVLLRGNLILLAPAFVVMMITVFTQGEVAMWSLILVGLFHSIMFPTIFTLGIKGLGPLTEEGSGLLIMAIAGGALVAVQGWLADTYGLQHSFLLTAVCELYILFYALWGSKPTNAIED